MNDPELDTSKFLTLEDNCKNYILCPVCKAKAAVVYNTEIEVEEPVRGHWKKGQGFIQTNNPVPAFMSVKIVCYSCGTETKMKGNREVIEEFLNKNLIK